MPKQVRHDGGGKVAHSFSPSDLPIWIPAKVKPPASMMMATIRETISKGVMAASFECSLLLMTQSRALQDVEKLTPS